MGNKDFIQRLRGRAEFCRDRGEIKTPELLERASNLLESQETERLKTQLLAAEAEISRLHSGFDGLKQYAVNCINRDGLESVEWEDGYLFASVRFLKEINRITGTDQ